MKKAKKLKKKAKNRTFKSAKKRAIVQRNKSVWKQKALNVRQIAQRARRAREARVKSLVNNFNASLPASTQEQLFDVPRTTPKGGHPRFHQIVQAMSDLHDKKNTDYAAGTAEGPLGNFLRASKIMRLYPGMDWASPFGVCMAFMLKQFDAGLTLKAQGRESVTGEPVSARLTDIAVYTVLGMILDEEENKTKQS